MAGLLDFFSPQDPNASPALPDFAPAQQQMSSFLDNPQGRAALLSAGLALMQSPSFGDTGASQIGRAIGAAGQSATANDLMDLKKAEQGSKEDLRAAQAVAAEARAGTAGARSDAAAQRLALEGEKLKALNDHNLLGNRIRLSGMYQNYVRDTAKRNENASLLKPGAPPEPVLSMPDWIKANPTLRSLGLIPNEGATGDTTDTEDTSTTTPTTQAPIPVPARKTDLKAGTLYSTSRGVATWDGTKFVQ